MLTYFREDRTGRRIGDHEVVQREPVTGCRTGQEGQRMLASRAVGREASTKKYDILTALGALALARDKGAQRLVLRLMVLITARYNWRNNELSMGRREIARLWSVNERTVKREMGKLKAAGWIRVKRPGARGRVSVYSLQFEAILRETETVWPAVGPDFVERMGAMSAPEGQGGKVVPLFTGADVPPPEVSGDSLWSRAQLVLHGRNATLYAAWFKALKQTGRAGGAVRLEAPNGFHADYVRTHHLPLLLEALREVDAGIGAVEIAV